MTEIITVLQLCTQLSIDLTETSLVWCFQTLEAYASLQSSCLELCLAIQQTSQCLKLLQSFKIEHPDILQLKVPVPQLS